MDVKLNAYTRTVYWQNSVYNKIQSITLMNVWFKIDWYLKIKVRVT